MIEIAVAAAPLLVVAYGLLAKRDHGVWFHWIAVAVSVGCFAIAISRKRRWLVAAPSLVALVALPFISVIPRVDDWRPVDWFLVQRHSSTSHWSVAAGPGELPLSFHWSGRPDVTHSYFVRTGKTWTAARLDHYLLLEKLTVLGTGEGILFAADGRIRNEGPSMIFVNGRAEPVLRLPDDCTRMVRADGERIWCVRFTPRLGQSKNVAVLEYDKAGHELASFSVETASPACAYWPIGTTLEGALVLGGGCFVDEKSQDFDSCVLARIDRSGVHPFGTVQPPCGAMEDKLPPSVVRPRAPIAEPAL